MQQFPPGVRLRLTSIYISVITSTESCTHVGGRDVALHSVLRVYSGCAPGRHVVYDSKASETNDPDYCDDAWPCHYFPAVFSPHFKLMDTVMQTSDFFVGSFFMDIISAGTTKDKSIWEWSNLSAKDVFQYNFAGSAQVWGTAEDVDPVMGTDGFLRAPLFTNPSNLSDQPGILPTQINFACAGGSPCSDIKPTFPDAPSLYLTVRFSTDYATNISYCAYETTFDLRLYQVPMSLSTQLTVAGLSIVVLIVGSTFVGVFWWFKEGRFNTPSDTMRRASGIYPEGFVPQGIRPTLTGAALMPGGAIREREAQRMSLRG